MYHLGKVNMIVNTLSGQDNSNIYFDYK